MGSSANESVMLITEHRILMDLPSSEPMAAMVSKDGFYRGSRHFWSKEYIYEYLLIS